MKENWVDRLVKQDYFSTVRRFTVAALLGVSSVVGTGAFVVMGVVAPAISATQHYFEKKRKQKTLLNFYADELGSFLGKSPESLNFEDLEKNSKHFGALSGPMEQYKNVQNKSIAIAVVSSVLTVALILGVAAWLGPAATAALPNLLQLGLVTAGYMAIRNTVSATTHTIFSGDDEKKCVSERLMQFSENLKERPITPVQVFGLFSEANPALNQDIAKKYGKTFEELSAMRKKEVVDAYEPELRINALTEAMNHDQIKPSFVGFLAYGQADKLPDMARYKELFNQPLIQGKELCTKPFARVEREQDSPEYVKRLMAQRAEEEDMLPSRLLN